MIEGIFPSVEKIRGVVSFCFHSFTLRYRIIIQDNSFWHNAAFMSDHSKCNYRFATRKQASHQQPSCNYDWGKVHLL